MWMLQVPLSPLAAETLIKLLPLSMIMVHDNMSNSTGNGNANRQYAIIARQKDIGHVTVEKKRTIWKMGLPLIGQCRSFIRKKTEVAKLIDCKKIWGTFKQAYVGRDPCDVPPEAYDPLLNSVKDDAACNTMLFWSQTNAVVHAFTKNRDCLVTVEDTLLGFMFKGLTWCSKNESKETFTTGCPDWSGCKNSPIQSFWLKASANFATTGCGKVSVMLNGSLDTPFNSSSIFASVEVKKLDPNKVEGLTILLVTNNTDSTTCKNPSFNNLKSSLNEKIAYYCREVPYFRVAGCISDLKIPCSDCL
ncbi:ADP-ribosyl cyclase/cyclic ADP-ribose hydrolase 1-like [Clarias gariepinus]|uniref:ADP-ribosyl cyclase/cyclic ADP-ribose hydrolase 1-like n=1 Tax=Clarias gariepinus TaxID=13013 RepID=UPI00234D92CB|nr:ADP-ribosyl cyclase/cyclic ADP-ribose hydrolase 1-like [Clarias gariepinus]